MVRMVHSIFYSELESPIGPLTIVGIAPNDKVDSADVIHPIKITRAEGRSYDCNLCCIEFGSFEEVRPRLENWLRKHSLYWDGCLVYDEDMLLPFKSALKAYFSGRQQENFQVPLQLYGTPFQKKVWQELVNIEYGSTKSYKNIAIAIGAPKAVRAIGTAIGHNPIPIIIPCHRVINSNGKLGGFTGGLDKKQKLLTIEGA